MVRLTLATFLVQVCIFLLAFTNQPSGPSGVGSVENTSSYWYWGRGVAGMPRDLLCMGQTPSTKNCPQSNANNTLPIENTGQTEFLSTHPHAFPAPSSLSVTSPWRALPPRFTGPVIPILQTFSSGEHLRSPLCPHSWPLPCLDSCPQSHETFSTLLVGL